MCRYVAHIEHNIITKLNIEPNLNKSLFRKMRTNCPTWIIFIYVTVNKCTNELCTRGLQSLIRAVFELNYLFGREYLMRGCLDNNILRKLVIISTWKREYFIRSQKNHPVVENFILSFKVFIIYRCDLRKIILHRNYAQAFICWCTQLCSTMKKMPVCLTALKACTRWRVK